MASPTPAPSQAPPISTALPSTTTTTTTTNGTKPLTAPSSSAAVAVPISGPAAASFNDPGLSTRPRDARTIHMVLASLGVTAYQERVPLQLLDFAYRYTAGILADAQHLAAEGYVTSVSAIGASTAHRGGKIGGAAGGGAGAGAGADDGGGSLAALRLATASRNGYQFSGSLPKETLLEMAGEKNKTRLPEVQKDVVYGVRLPSERFVMNGVGWGLLEEWDSEVDEEEDAGLGSSGGGGGGVGAVNGVAHVDGAADEKMVNGEVDGEVNRDGDTDREDEEKEDEEMADEDGLEQMFGGGGDDDNNDGGRGNGNGVEEE